MSTKTIPSVFCAITFLVALLCEPIIAQNGNCEIEGVADLDWFQSKDFTVLDTNTDDIFDETATNVMDVKSLTQSDNVNSANLYMKAEIIGSKFVVYPTELFAKYEEQETSLSFGLSVEFTCAIQTKKLLIIFNIKDTNNHSPEFLPGNNYEYKILTPMPAGIPISTFYGAIKVRDYDLTTKSIIFGIEENDYLEMVYDSVEDTKKVHTGILKSVKAILRLDDPLVLKISATDVDDTGDEPKTSYATITITSDPLTQLPTAPLFSSTYYTGIIEDGHLTIYDQIEISVGYSDDIVLAVSDDEYFSVTNDGSIVTISLKGVIPEEVLAAKDHFLFSLFAAKDNTEGGSAAIFISIPKVLKFEQSSYKGSYDGELSIEDIVLIGYHDKVELHLSGDSIDFFDFTNDGGVVQITTKGKLPEEVVDGTNNRLVLLLEATSPNNHATATILIELPEKVPDPIIEFVDIVHKATYTFSDKTLAIEPIQLKPGFPSDLVVDLSGDAKDYFTATLQGDSVTISVSPDIPESLAADSPYTVLTLKASAANSVDAYAVITVELVEEHVPDPIIEFVEIVHKATYTFSGKTFATEPIQLKPGFPSDLVVDLSGDAKDYFTAKLQGDSVTISLLLDIPESLAADSPYTVLTLRASSAANSINAYAIITVELVLEDSDLTIEFMEIVHKATYSFKDKYLTISPIELKTGFPSDIAVELSGDAKDYFTAELQGDSVTISVLQDIPESLAADSPYTVLTLRASSAANSINAYAIITVELVLEDSDLTIEFMEIVHKATYSFKDKYLTISPIELKTGFPSDIAVELSGDAKDYFTAELQGDSVTISVLQDIPESLAADSPYTVLTLRALTAANSINAYAVITVALVDGPDEIFKPTLTFESPYYQASYSVEDVLSTPTIALNTGSPAGAKFKLTGENAAFFTPTSADGISVTIEVTTPLTEDILSKNSYIVVVLEADAPNALDGLTIINIALPEKDDSSKTVLKFEKPFYEGTYSKLNELVLEPAKLTEEFTSEVSVSLSGAFVEYFTAKVVGSTVTIEMSKELTADILDSYSVLSLVLEAQVEGAVNGHTIISITLPEHEDVDKKVLKFENSVYDAAYLKETTLIIPLVKLTEEVENVVFEILGDNAKLFTVTSVGSTVTINLKEAFSDDLLNSNSYIALVLEANAVDAVNGQTVINIALPTKDEIIKPTLTFESPYYQASYSVEDVLNTPKIALNTGSPPNAKFKLSGDNAAFFTPTSADGIFVTIEVTTPLTEDILSKNYYIVVVLEAEAPNSLDGLTIINIALPEKDQIIKPTLTFESPYYHASYSVEDVLTTPTIALKPGSPAEAQFKLSGENAAFFTPTSADGISVTIEVTTPLTEDILSKNSYIVVVLEADAPNALDGLTIINIALPEKDDSSKTVLKFEKPFYEGTYSKLNELVLEPAKLTEEFSSAVSVSLSGAFVEHFTAKVVGSTVTIEMSKELTADVLDSYSVLSLVLEAQVEGAVNGHTIISITLPEHEDVDKKVLKFENSVYDAAYLKETTLIIPLVKLTEEVENVVFEILGDNAKLFTVTSVGSTVTINLKEAFSDDLLNSNSYIALVLEAKAVDAVNGQTVINIALPTKDEVIKPTLTFESPYYQASYSVEDVLNTPKIALNTGSPANAKFKLSGDNAAFFTPTSADGISVTIEVTTPLTEDILSKNSYIVVVLEADAPNALDGLTIINIALPEKDDSSKTVLKFEKPFYEGTYSKLNELVLEPAKLTEEFSSAVSVSLSGAFVEYFTAKVVGSTVTIEMSKELTADILDSYSVLSLVLEAQVEGAVNGHTIISITLPEHEDVDKKVLKFENSVYDAAYLKETTLIIPLVKLTEEVENVVFEILGDNAKLFTVTSVGSTVTINLKEAFSDDLLNSNSYIALVLEAKAVDAVNGQTVINIALPTKDEVIKPTLTFESPYYQASYSGEDVLTTPKVALITGSPANAKFKLSGDNAAFFTPTSADGISVTIEVTTPLTEDILSKNSYIVVVLEADAPNALDGLTIINIALPEKEDSSKTVLKFEKPFYEGTYSILNELVHEPAKLTEEFSSAVSVSLSGAFVEYFTAKVVGSTVTIEMSKELTADILDSYSVLSLVLEAQVEGAVNGHTIISITLPEHEDVDKKVLKFENSVYDAAYLKETTLIIPLVKLTEEVENVVFEILGDNAKLFTVTSVGSTVTINLKEAFSDDLLNSNSYIALVLEAKAVDAVNGQTVINIALPTKDEVIKPTLTFESPYYQASYSVEGVLTTPTIALNTGSPANAQFKLSGDNAAFFTPTSADGISVTIEATTPLTNDILSKNSYIVVVLEAEASNVLDGLTIINIALPGKDPQISVKFEKNFYTGSYAFSTNDLSLSEMILEEGYSKEVEFTLVGEYSQLFKVTPNDNVVTVNVVGDIPENVLDQTSVLVFSLQATRPDAPSATTVIAVKLIRKTGNPGNALTIIDIIEGRKYDHLDIGELEDGCKYKILSSWPSTPDWFYTDSDGTLKSNIVIREDPSVANLYLSQVQLEMGIECVSSATQKNLREEDENEERFWISTKNINLEENKKLVTIIIRDINNNYPIFDTIGPVTVGFPAKEIAYVLRPQSLITVNATDADIGINALIKYTTESDHFSVHPDTGVVYPKTDLYSLVGTTEELSFTVVATDEYGAGNAVSLEIKVKSLDESHIVVVKVEDGVMENVEEIIAALSSQTTYSIKVLSAAVLPDSEIKAKLGSDRQNKASLVSGMNKDLSGDDTELTMFLYALDSQNNFVTASDLSSLISSGNAALPWEVKGETLTDSSLLLSVSATSDNTGLIVGVSVLGVLLFITLTGIVAYYFLVIRKTYSSFTNSSNGSSIADSEDGRKSGDVDYVNERPATLPHPLDSENLASTMSDVINPSFNTKDRPDHFNTVKDLEANNAHSKEDNFSDIDDDEYGASASKDRKRSIRFNPKVLQIDIDTSDLMEDERL